MTDRDRGMSFVEVLVAVVILGLAGVAVLGAAAAAARGASLQRNHANAQSVTAAAADEIMGTTPVVCSGAKEAYQAAGRARIDMLGLGAGWTGAALTVGAVREWDPATRQFKAYVGDPVLNPLSACITSVPEFVTPQLVPLTVTSPDGRTTKYVEVVTAAIPDRVPIGNPLVFGEAPFAVLTFGDLHLSGQLHVYGGAAVGRNLSFDGNQASLGHTGEPGVYIVGDDGAPASLVVDGKVDYANSSGELSIGAGWIHVGDMSNGEYATESSKLVLRGVPASTPRIVFATGITQASDPGSIEQSGIYDFVAAQRAFTAESAALAQLPGQCVDAAIARLLDQHGDPATSTGQAHWELVPYRANVLTTTLSQLPSGQVSKASFHPSLSPPPEPLTPLIVNVMDGQGGATIVFNQGHVTNQMESQTIWNFPNATGEIRVTGEVAGSILAPNAHVVLDANVNGALIAGSMSGGYAVMWAGNRPAVREITCDRGL